MAQAIFITWTEQEQQFDSWRVVSGLGTEPMFKTVVRKRAVRYSSEVTDQMIERARAYIQSDMQDRNNVKVEIR